MITTLLFVVTGPAPYAIRVVKDSEPARLLRDGIATPRAAKEYLNSYEAGASLLGDTRIASIMPPEIRRV